MNTLNGHTPPSMSIEDPGYESGGQGTIFITVVAACTSLTLILYTLYRWLTKAAKA